MSRKNFFRATGSMFTSKTGFEVNIELPPYSYPYSPYPYYYPYPYH